MIKHRAWILIGNIYSIPGTASYGEGRFHFRSHTEGNAPKKKYEQILESLKRLGVEQSLSGETSLFQFSVALSEISELKSPWYQMKCGFTLKSNGQTLRFSLLKPQNTKSHDYIDQNEPSLFAEFSSSRAFCNGLIADLKRTSY